MRNLKTWLAGAAVMLLTTGPALAADVYVVHGINGTDLGLDEALPVDVEVKGVGVDACIENLMFRDQPGPTELPAPATYNIKIHLGGGSGCTGAVVIDTNVELLSGQIATIIAHLNDSGQPKASVFNNNTAPTAPGNTRVAVHHTAAAPAVDVTFLPNKKWSKFRRIADLANSEQGVRDFRAGKTAVLIKPAGGGLSLMTVERLKLPLEASTTYLVYAVGTLAKGTFELLILPLDAG